MSKYRNKRKTLKSIWNRDSHRVKVAEELLVSEVYIFSVIQEIQERLMGSNKMLKCFKTISFPHKVM